MVFWFLSIMTRESANEEVQGHISAYDRVRRHSTAVRGRIMNACRLDTERLITVTHDWALILNLSRRRDTPKLRTCVSASATPRPMCLGENSVSRREQCVSTSAQSHCDTRGTRGLDQSEPFFLLKKLSDWSKPLVPRVSHRDCAFAETHWSRTYGCPLILIFL